jgi:hypothetical protein
LTSVAYRGAPLMGIFFGDDKRIDRILQGADTISVRNEMEDVGGSGCYVIDAMTQYGKYTIWIDPQHGYNIAKAEVKKEGGDLAWGDKPVAWGEKQPPASQYIGGRPPTAKKALSFSLENVRFEKVDNIWVPMEADYQYIKMYQENRAITVKRHHKRTRIDFDPDFEAIGAFVPDIPDGTRVFLDHAAGISYTWQNGKLVPDVDELVLEQLDSITDEVRSDTEVLSVDQVEKNNEMPTKPGQTPSKRADIPDRQLSATKEPQTNGDESEHPVVSTSFSLSIILTVICSLILGFLCYVVFRGVKRA